MAATLDDYDRLLTPRQTAERFGCSVRTLDKFVADGVIQAVRLRPNSNRRFRASDVSALIESGGANGTEDDDRDHEEEDEDDA